MRKAYVSRGQKIKCEHCGQEVSKESSKQRWCKACVPEKKWRSIMKRYGLSQEEWTTLLAKQNGVCLLCDKKPRVVDHDHLTGRVRGLLCDGCNSGMGFVDNKEWLEKAVRYANKKPSTV